VTLGVALMVPGTLDEAAACFQEASRINPDYSLPYFNLGNVRLRQGRYAEAADAFRACLGIRPNHAEAHNNLGSALLELDRPDEAIAHFQRATVLQPRHIHAHRNLGMTFELKGDADRAISAFEQAVCVRPKDAVAWLYMGRMLQRKGRLAEAVAALRKADQLGAGKPGLGYPSGQWLAEARRLLALEPRLPGLLEGKVKPASAEECLDWAQLCLSKGRTALAASLYRQAFDEKPALAEAGRFGAVQAAAQAGCGVGVDVDKLSDKERATWRAQALNWLRADLASWSRGVATDPRSTRSMLLALNHWRCDIALAGVRDPARRRKLPADEQRRWQQLWEEVDALYHKPGRR
jgi:tetratricopeptide (TPR) repeat protein